jgi:hypothetical protein
MREEFESIDVVARAVDRITRHGRFADFELSNGIILTLKPVPPFLLQAVMGEFKDPEVPVVFMQEKGRDEPNPNDPEYIKAMEEVSAKQDKAINDFLLSVGTDVKSIPEGYFPPESDEWIKQIEFASEISGANIYVDKENPIKRYLYWLRFYAIETGFDSAVINTIAYSLGGIREGEVQEVIDSFRSLPERRADTEPAIETIGQNGHTANRADRRQRTRDGGA